MKKLIKQVISIIILTAIISGLLPFAEIRAMAASEGVVSISNEYIAVDVSEKNGGFLIRTKVVTS